MRIKDFLIEVLRYTGDHVLPVDCEFSDHKNNKVIDMFEQQGRRLHFIVEVPQDKVLLFFFDLQCLFMQVIYAGLFLREQQALI